MQTDQVFKDILHAFFEDFLALFLPELAAEIEPGSITFLDPEIFTGIRRGHDAKWISWHRCRRGAVSRCWC